MLERATTVSQKFHCFESFHDWYTHIYAQMSSNTYTTFERSIEEGVSTMNGEYVGYGW
jgi:hypothetical protein